jgi:hypothetical protein
MANELFKNFPKIGYRLESGKYVTIRDFFRKSTVEQSFINDIIDYEYYELQDGERPDIVATKIYGNGDLHWTLFLVNEFLNYNDWHKDTETFDIYMKEKYPGHYLTVTNVSDLIDQDKKFLLGEKISTPVGHGRVLQLQPTYKRLGVTNSTKWRTGDVITGEVSGKSFEIENVIEMKDGVSHYVNSDGLKKNYFENGYTSVSLIEHEMEHNEEKRKIKIIRPELINRVVNEFERLMSN